MDFRRLNIYIVLSMSAFVSSENVVPFIFPWNKTKLISIGEKLHLNILDTRSQNIVRFEGVHQMKVLIDKSTKPCCWEAIINNTGKLDSCSESEVSVNKNNLNILVYRNSSSRETCSNDTVLYFIIKSKLCRNDYLKLKKEKLKDAYEPGDNVTVNCNSINGPGEMIYKCHGTGEWLPVNNCSATAASSRTTHRPSAMYSPSLPSNSEFVGIMNTSSILNGLSGMATISTQAESQTLKSNELNVTQSSTIGFFNSNVSMIGTSFINNTDYETLASSFWQNSSPTDIVVLTTTPLLPSYQSNNIMSTVEDLLLSSDSVTVESKLESSTDHYNASNSSVLTETFSTRFYDEKDNSTISELKSSSDNQYGGKGASPTDNQFATKSMSHNSGTLDAVFKSEKIFLEVSSANTGIILLAFDNRTLFQATAMSQSSIHDEQSSTVLESNLTNSISDNGENNNHKSKQKGPSNSDIALGVTIVLFAVIVLVLVTLIFRVVWKSRKNRNNRDTQKEGSKFADVSPLAQFHVCPNNPEPEVEHFMENLCYIELGEVDESNTDDDVSSKYNSENSAHDGEDNTIEQRHKEMKDKTSNNKLETFTGCHKNPERNSIHKHNYNQKVGGYTSVKRNIKSHTIQQHQNKMKDYPDDKNSDVYAVSYKHRSIR